MKISTQIIGPDKVRITNIKKDGNGKLGSISTVELTKEQLTAHIGELVLVLAGMEGVG